MRLQHVISAACALALAGPALARSESVHEFDNGELRTIVRYGDLDLHSAMGAHALLARILDASRRVCHAAEPSRSVQLGRTQIFHDCVRSTLDGAIAALDAPMVTAAYREEAVSDLLAAR